MKLVMWLFREQGGHKWPKTKSDSAVSISRVNENDGECCYLLLLGTIMHKLISAANSSCLLFVTEDRILNHACILKASLINTTDY
jgi:hypothetical protein